MKKNSCNKCFYNRCLAKDCEDIGKRCFEAYDEKKLRYMLVEVMLNYNRLIEELSKEDD